MKTHAKSSIIIKSSKELVWKGITNPDLVEQYFFGTKLEATWEVGSTIYFRGAYEGLIYEDKGIIVSIKPEQHLAYNYWSSMSGTTDVLENYNQITYDLAIVEDGVKLSVVQEISEDKKEHTEGIWNMILTGLKGVVEKL